MANGILKCCIRLLDRPLPQSGIAQACVKRSTDSHSQPVTYLHLASIFKAIITPLAFVVNAQAHPATFLTHV